MPKKKYRPGTIGIVSKERKTNLHTGKVYMLETSGHYLEKKPVKSIGIEEILHMKLHTFNLSLEENVSKEIYKEMFVKYNLNMVFSISFNIFCILHFICREVPL